MVVAFDDKGPGVAKRLLRSHANKFYVTTPIYYINSIPTIGSAYTTFLADAIARFKRICGRDVFFLTGLDENSVKTVQTAKERGLDTKRYADGMAVTWRDAWKRLGVSNDDFIRTTEQRHVQNVLGFFAKVRKNGDIYEGKYVGLYCEGCENFVSEDELADGLCPLHNKPPRRVEEENYFFKLSKYQKFLIAHIKDNPGFIEPESRRNEVLSFLRNPLKDISISRPGLEWGITLPIDSGQRFWVWFDALVNYLAAGDYWPADLHIVGKDILRFHAIIWPAMLESAGYELPKKILAHGFFTASGRKISKSAGNAIDPLDLAGKYGVEALRYYLLVNLPYGEDGDFSEHDLVTRFNNELVANIGNFAYRVLSFIHAKNDGVVPRPEKDGELGAESRKSRDEIARRTKELLGRVGEEYEAGKVDRAIREILGFSGACNRYFQSEEPWKNARNATCLQQCTNAVRTIAIAIYPVSPQAAQSLWSQLNESGKITWKYGSVEYGRKLGKIETIFKKIDVSNNKVQEAKKMVSFEDFEKLEIKTGKIISAENIIGKDRLYRLEVDIGKKIQLVAGLAQHYKKDELVGKSVIVLANLEPAKIGGVVSEGMLLCAEKDGRVSLLSPEKDVGAGATVV